MQQRILGDTGLLVSPLGLGLAALGRPGYINLGHAADLQAGYDPAAMASHAAQVMDVAWAGGVRYFDAARSYGRAEEFLGHWLRTRAIAPEEVVIGSKWGYTYTADWRVTAERHEVKDHTLATLQRQWPASQALLQPYLRLYQVHSATLESGILTDRAALAELAELKQRGVNIGLSLSGPQQAATLVQALACTVAGRRLFDSVQATWNILEPSVGSALALAHAAGVGVIVKEALANGRLTERNSDPDFGAKLAVLRRAAKRRGVGVDAVALAAALAQPWATVVLSGAATVAQITANLAALDVAWDDELADQLATLAEAPDVYWRIRSQLPWN